MPHRLTVRVTFVLSHKARGTVFGAYYVLSNGLAAAGSEVCWVSLARGCLRPFFCLSVRPAARTGGSSAGALQRCDRLPREERAALRFLQAGRRFAVGATERIPALWRG